MNAGFFEQPGMFLFTVSAFLLTFYVVIELVSLMLIGTGVGHLLDTVLPGHDADISHAAEGALAKAFGWLYLGRVPLMIILMLFLGGFAASGFAVQGVAFSIFGGTLPWLLAYSIGVAGGLAVVRLCAPPVARLLAAANRPGTTPTDFVGAVGVVTVGTMTAELASTVRVRALSGEMHFLAAKALRSGDSLAEGRQVVLQKKDGAFWLCVAADSTVAI